LEGINPFNPWTKSSTVTRGTTLNVGVTMGKPGTKMGPRIKIHQHPTKGLKRGDIRSQPGKIDPGKEFHPKTQMGQIATCTRGKPLWLHGVSPGKMCQKALGVSRKRGRRHQTRENDGG